MLQWLESGSRLQARQGERLVFDDSAEHWRDGVLRLMQWSPDQGRAFVESAVDQAGGAEAWGAAPTASRADAMKRAGALAWPEPAGAEAWTASDRQGFLSLGQPLDVFWTRALAGDSSVALAGTQAPAHGVLLQRDAQGRAVLAQAPAYEEAYFEGAQGGYGYGRLEEQSLWRMEKARRQARQLQAFLGFAGAIPEGRAIRFLDVGSGYGYLRQAAQELGWQHEGLELSKHACAAAQRFFGFESFQGFLDQHPGRGFDCLAMMDLLEHVSDPVGLLAQAAERLVPGGLCVVRTPNLLALEREVFGHRYHSFKREHLQCFSPESLALTLQAAGLDPIHLSTEAHLFQGLLGPGVQVLARLLRGSDILAVGQKMRAA